MHHDRFCQCPCCHVWLSSREILESPLVEPLGMAFQDEDPGGNLLFFNHVAPGCGSTFTVEAHRFEPFLLEVAPPEVMAGTPSCEHRCTSMQNLLECQTQCQWAPYRRFLVQLRAQRKLAAR